MQEQTDIHKDANSQGLMLFFTDDAWWLCLPGWGRAKTEWIARSNWLEMVAAGMDENYSKHNLEVQAFFVPYNMEKTCMTIKCFHGQAWLHDYMRAMHLKDMQGYNELLEAQSVEAREGTVVGNMRPTAKARPTARANANGNSSSSGDAIVIYDDGDAEPYDDGDAEPYDDGDAELYDDGDWKPKAGSLNHKVALIGAYYMKDWHRMKKLVQTLLVLMFLYVL